MSDDHQQDFSYDHSSAQQGNDTVESALKEALINADIGSSESIDSNQASAPEMTSSVQDDLDKLIYNNSPVVAEADSSTSAGPSVTPVPSPAAAPSASKTEGCSYCPYFAFGGEYLKKLQLPPKVEDMILWKNPKHTGALFGTSFVLLLSIATFSLLAVVSTLALLCLSVIGSYRFYLALVFRIKGTADETFERLSAYELKYPKEKIQDIAESKEIENIVNRVLKTLKSIVLWDNVVASSIAFFVLYCVYYIGLIFNTVTLLILALVCVFTLPKVYQVYKVQIDQVIEKLTNSCHCAVKQAMTKMPFLQKKKTQ